MLTLVDFCVMEGGGSIEWDTDSRVVRLWRLMEDKLRGGGDREGFVKHTEIIDLRWGGS